MSRRQVKTHPEGQRQAKGPERPVVCEADHVVFLGQDMSREEYREACSNLAGYFKILKEWSEDERADEEETNL